MMRRALCLCLAVQAAVAGEYALLTTGFRLRAERHERAGNVVRFFNGDGVTEIPAALVASIEPDDYVPPPPAPISPPAVAQAKPPAPTPRELVRGAALRSGLPPSFLESVAKVESAFRPDALSPKGALGVMQLMPSTARALNLDPNDPAQNIEAGARLLRELLIQYEGDVVKALAAYNAGPGAVRRFNGLPPYRETRNYVDRVVREYQSREGSPDPNKK